MISTFPSTIDRIIISLFWGGMGYGNSSVGCPAAAGEKYIRAVLYGLDGEYWTGRTMGNGHSGGGLRRALPIKEYYMWARDWFFWWASPGGGGGGVLTL